MVDSKRNDSFLNDDPVQYVFIANLAASLLVLLLLTRFTFVCIGNGVVLYKDKCCAMADRLCSLDSPL